jgi:hypothetical protein
MTIRTIATALLPFPGSIPGFHSRFHSRQPLPVQYFLFASVPWTADWRAEQAFILKMIDTALSRHHVPLPLRLCHEVLDLARQ